MKRLLALMLLLVSCAPTAQDYNSYLADKGVNETAPARFDHCSNYGCKKIQAIELTKKEWESIEAPFKKRAKNAEQERAKIAKSIAAFEIIIGDITGTSGDKAGTFEDTGPGQLDCVDESTNTTVYLAVLAEKGLLKFHTLQSPTARLPFIHTSRWPHQTAVIKETESGEYYAVDSWFHDNGREAEIVPLAQWKGGWDPEVR